MKMVKQYSIGSKSNIAQSPRTLRVADTDCRGLFAFPEARRLRPELGQGVRLSVFGNHVVLYVVHEDILEIRRVVHGARDLAGID
jgi:plasmid stabilization system protein ParE